jgi:DNA-binding XRE family transcriptional regulator
MAPTNANAATADGATFHERMLDRGLEDPDFRVQYESQRRQIAAIDEIVNRLNALREQAGTSKADLARAVGKNEASIQRLLINPANPELRTVVALADALGADVQIVARKSPAHRRRAAAEVTEVS